MAIYRFFQGVHVSYRLLFRPAPVGFPCFLQQGSLHYTLNPHTTSIKNQHVSNGQQVSFEEPCPDRALEASAALGSAALASSTRARPSRALASGRCPGGAGPWSMEARAENLMSIAWWFNFDPYPRIWVPTWVSSFFRLDSQKKRCLLCLILVVGVLIILKPPLYPGALILTHAKTFSTCFTL